MTSAPTSVASPVLLAPGEGHHVWGRRACITVKAAVAALGALELLAPPDFGPPLHVHHREDEILHVLDGTVRVACGDRDEILETGGFALLPRGIPHAFWVLEGPARMFLVFVPGGAEAMFVDAGEPAESARLPEPGTVPAGAMEPFERRHGVETVGPPLAAR